MWSLVLAALAAAPPARALADTQDPWRSTGSFGTDTWLPHDMELERLLARADEALHHDPKHADLDAVFRAWNSALASQDANHSTGASVRWDTRVHWKTTEEDPPIWNDRRSEGLNAAILLRLAQADGALTAPWQLIAEPAAAAAHAAAASLPVERALGPLAAVSRRYPGTLSGARAALACSDLERERGRSQHAAAWITRATESARLLHDEALDAAIAARQNHEDSHGGPQLEAEAWELAADWVFVEFVPLTDLLQSPAAGVRGLTRWNHDSLFIQGAGIAWTIDGLGTVQAHPLRDLAKRSGQPLAEDWMRPGSAWQHRPTAAADLTICVVGRVRDARSNALHAFHPDTHLLPLWSVGPGGWRDARGEQLADLTRALGPGAWEFQPGPIVVDDLLIAQARRWDLSDDPDHPLLIEPARPEAVALAFHLQTGALAWRTTLARGSEHLVDTTARFLQARTPARSAPSPVLCGTSLVFATGLGACVALDLLDGQPQRAILGRRTPDGIDHAPRPIPTSADTAIWMPHRGKNAYELALGSDHLDLGTTPFAHPPSAAETWTSIIGTHHGRLLVAIARGGRHQLELLGHGDQRPRRSVQLSPSEVLVGAYALSTSRLITASDRGIFTFDLERQLYLTGHLPLDPRVPCLRDGLVATRSALWALSKAGVYRLRPAE
jgi:hypothetical protein